jgi:hypothetical protein
LFIQSHTNAGDERWLAIRIAYAIGKKGGPPLPNTASGTERTSNDVRLESVMRARADIGESGNREHERPARYPTLDQYAVPSATGRGGSPGNGRTSQYALAFPLCATTATEPPIAIP